MIEHTNEPKAVAIPYTAMEFFLIRSKLATDSVPQAIPPIKYSFERQPGQPASLSFSPGSIAIPKLASGGCPRMIRPMSGFSTGGLHPIYNAPMQSTHNHRTVSSARRIDWMKLILVLGTTMAFHSGLSSSAEKPTLDYSGTTTWDESTKTFSFTKSGAMPATKEGFYWSVPDEVDRIMIGSDVTVTGAFRIGYREPSNPLFISGEDRDTSVIFGTPDKQWTTDNNIPENAKWTYGAISVLADATVHVSKLTSKDPRSYHISGYANKSVIHVNECNLLDTRGGDNNNSDGFIGSAGSSIRRSTIDTLDDGIKVYHDIIIESVMIRQHRNGAAIQLGWGGESDDVTASIRDLTIVGANPDHLYNMAPFTWEAGTSGSRNIEVTGMKVQFTGKIYNESTAEWDQAGLFELKPKDGTFNFHASNAALQGLGLGRRDTKGVIQIEEMAAAQTGPESGGID